MVRPEFKKLYARLLKTEIEKYLITRRCDNVLIEYGADELFASCLQYVREQSRVAVLVPGFTGDHRDALGIFIDHGFGQPPWMPAFVAMLVDFAAWNIENGRRSPDLGPVLETLLEMGVAKEVLGPLVSLPATGLSSPIQSIEASASASGKVVQPASGAAGRARLFIGSSKEGLVIAEALQAGLDQDFECTIWNQGVFGLSATAIESLEKQLTRSDFAVVVITPDDTTTSRGAKSATPRDNVVFELGLFMGAFGRMRTFVVRPRRAAVKLPSDMWGITVSTYDDERTDGNIRASVGKACSDIKLAVQKIGRR